MSSTPRRSSRLKAKEEDKQAKEATLRSKRRNLSESDSSYDENQQQREAGGDSESEDMEEDDDDVLKLQLVTTPAKTLRKTNNFTKIHSSYNKDYGLDTYEEEFIDDTEFIRRRHTPLKRPRPSSNHHSGKDHSSNPKAKRAVQAKRIARANQLSSESDSGSSLNSDTSSSSSRKAPKIKKPKIRSYSNSDKRQIRISSDESDKEGLGDRTTAAVSPKLSNCTVDNPSIPLSSDVNTPVRITGALSHAAADNDGGASSEDEKLTLSLSAKRRRVKSALDLLSSSSSSSSEEVGSNKSACGGEEGVKLRKRKRLLKEFESDDDISVKEETTDVRQPSSRAEKLRQQKENKNKRVLQKIQAERSGKSTKSSLSSGDSSNGEAEKVFESIFDTTNNGDDPTNNDSNRSPLSLAEQILFPPNDTESSDEEDSDWIVSDDDSELMNINELELMNIQKPICYHFESESCETREAILLKTEDTLLTNDVHIPIVELDSTLSKTRLSGLLLHEAVNGEEPVSRLKELLPKMEGKLDTVDDNGYTPLMWAAVKGHSDVMKLLLVAGASVNCKDSSGTTPLHLAAASGWVECVELLIQHGHPVECRDDQGWPPLLYAHFTDREECVLALMRAGPQQLSVLSDLLRKTPSDRMDDRKKTIKVVRSLLISLAHHETYYSIFNDFIRDNPAVLEDDGFGFMKHCMALLSFENKQAWLKMKLKKLRDYAHYSASNSLSLHNIPRDDLLLHVLQRLCNLSPPQCWLAPLMVTFKGEYGICSGPRREFWSCLSQSLAEGNERLFKLSDEGQLCLQPCSIFSKYFYSIMNHQLLQRHTQHLQLVGCLLAYALFHGDTVGIFLSEPLLKQLVGLSLSHPEDLESVDRSLYYSYTEYLKGCDEIEDLELTFVETMVCPWNEKTVDIPIRENGRTLQVTKENKEEYVKCVSKFKLESSVQQELGAFLNGFWKVIPKKCLEVFTPNELSLLLSGVPTIDVDDWYKNTQYSGFSPNDDIIVWFWKLVRSLKEEEKALLLKFATGSPRVPAGGFSSLQGLGDCTKFTISLIAGKDKIPQASTCFNRLQLTDYSREQELRNKILIAIRYGCEGFEFA